MQAPLNEIVQLAVVDPRIAGLIGGTTAVTSTHDYVHGGVSLLALASGAILSLTLIVIHCMRWNEEKRQARIRLAIDIAASKREHEKIVLENRVLLLELKALRDKDK